MCGIIGGINIALKEGDVQKIRHRGPDEWGMYKKYLLGHSVVLGHTRLSIVDLSTSGHQPMVSECGQFVIVFNGEVYNHLELRKEIKGIRFRGHSDTETILYYLIKKGAKGLAQLNGIFSLCLFDIQRAKLILARDHFGVKPLYYYLENGRFAFSSEIRGISRFVDRLDIDFTQLYLFLRLRYNPSPQTMLLKVQKLAPGHYLSIDLQDIERNTPVLFSYQPGYKLKLSEEEALDQYDYYLRQAIRRQLMSDVPISILLSGGVDSALLAKIAVEVSSKNFHSYTAGYKDKSKIDEIEEARITARYLGLPNKEVLIEDQDFSKFLSKFIDIIEEPLGSQSIVPLYYLSQQIHGDGYKVALSGQGVDELWGGYPKYSAHLLIQSLSKVFKRFTFFRGILKHDQWRRTVNAATAGSLVDRFIEIGSVFDYKQMSELITAKDVLEKGEQHLKQLYQDKFELFQYHGCDPLDALSYFDLRTNLSDDLLLYTDKISMFHSLEIRVPYLDLDLTRFVESLPYSYKANLFSKKILHKKLAAQYLPAEIVNRKKKGFATPRRVWFKGALGHHFEEKILSADNWLTHILNKVQIRKMFVAHRSGKVNYEKQLYLIICLFLWSNMYSNGRFISPNSRYR